MVQHLRPAIIELPVHCWLLEHNMRMWPKDLRHTATDSDALLRQTIFNSGTFPQSFCINCLQIASSTLEFSTRMRKRWMDVKKTSWDTSWIRFYHSRLTPRSCQSAWGTGVFYISSAACLPFFQARSCKVMWNGQRTVFLITSREFSCTSDNWWLEYISDSYDEWFQASAALQLLQYHPMVLVAVIVLWEVCFVVGWWPSSTLQKSPPVRW